MHNDGTLLNDFDLNGFKSFSVSAAARLLENMDMTVDPCDNFFEYSCGGWMKKHVIPESSAIYSTFFTLRDKLDVLVKGHTHIHMQPREILSASVIESTCFGRRRPESLKREHEGRPSGCVTP